MSDVVKLKQFTTTIANSCGTTRTTPSVTWASATAATSFACASARTCSTSWAWVKTAPCSSGNFPKKPRTTPDAEENGRSQKPRKTPLFLIVSCLRPFYHKFSVFLNICQFLAFIRSTFFSLTSLCWLLFYSMRSTPLSSPRLPLYVNNTVVYSKLFFSSVPSFVSPLQLYLWISFISTAASWGRRSRRPTNSLSVITRFDYFK